MGDDMTAPEVAEMFDLTTPVSGIQPICACAKEQRAPSSV
jgi:hypothetical protein